MNETLKLAAHQILKDLLSQCTEGEQTFFKRMYCHRNLGLPINEAVDQMADEKIDHAIYQCKRSIAEAKALGIFPK